MLLLQKDTVATATTIKHYVATFFKKKKNKRDERLTEWTDDDHDDYTAVESPTIHHISMKRKKVN